MSGTLAAILGGAAGGAVALVGIIALIWFCIFHNRSASRTSETGSSDPSVQVGRNVGVEMSLRDAKRFQLEELYLATKNFAEMNLIGQGKFGEVYKGMLHNGMLVAVKRRPGAPTQEFIEEVRYLSFIEHQNIVSLLGFCQENNQQFLVYEYVPNGSISSHLYGSGQVSGERLDFKHRLSIAIGAAKGLAYLHSLSPRLIHKDFKTSNVLVDENFIAKVADAGLLHFLRRADIAGPSSQVAVDEIFLAPEVREFRRFSEKGDVYSFGVFLLELISGREAMEPVSANSNQNFVKWVQNHPEAYRDMSSSIIDEKLGSSYTAEGMSELIQVITQCLDPSSERRPTMGYVVGELDRTYEKEVNLTIVIGEETPTVTLGSQLFRASK